MAQLQQSYMKDATAFLNFIEKTKVGKDTILVSMNISSLYTNIPQEEGKKHTKSSNLDIKTHYKPNPIYTLRLVPPTRLKSWFHQRRSNQIA